MFPGGHAMNDSVDTGSVLQHKFKQLGKLAMTQQDLVNFVVQLESI